MAREGHGAVQLHGLRRQPWAEEQVLDPLVQQYPDEQDDRADETLYREDDEDRDRSADEVPIARMNSETNPMKTARGRANANGRPTISMTPNPKEALMSVSNSRE